MNSETRMICVKCGACAGHPEDRKDGKCKHCGEVEIEFQERSKGGEWITIREKTIKLKDAKSLNGSD